MNPSLARLLLAATASAALLASACSQGGTDVSEAASISTVPDDAVATVTSADVVTRESLSTDRRARVERVLGELTVDEKIGQLLMPVVAGTDASDVAPADAAVNLQATGLRDPAEIVSDFHLGGVLYLETNVESAEQLRALSSELQTVARADTDLGLLVAVDQEGGRVNRITDQVTLFPSAAVLAGDAEAVTEAGFVTGQQLRGQGVNVVLAPVADVVLPEDTGFIGDRSFGTDPETVAEMVSGSIRGLQQSGVAAAVKHWPGHGATSTDSHLQLPSLDVDRAQWDARERIPFDAAIDDDVAIVVVGHLAVPGLDPSGAPATVSEVIIDELLRREAGFDGVVMTDALNMGAVGQYDSGQLAVDAILAGADVLLVPPDLADAYESLRSAATTGRLPADRLDESVRRVLILKDKLGLLPEIS